MDNIVSCKNREQSMEDYMTELAKTEVNRLVQVLHKQGLNYWQILGIFLVMVQNLYLQAGLDKSPKLYVGD